VIVDEPSSPRSTTAAAEVLDGLGEVVDAVPGDRGDAGPDEQMGPARGVGPVPLD